MGRSKTTPGADIIFPIQWDGGSSRYILGKSKAVFGCKVDNGHFPLRQGPDSVRPNSTDDFDGFVQAFEYTGSAYKNPDPKITLWSLN